MDVCFICSWVEFTAESDDDKYELPGDEEVKAVVPNEKEEEPTVNEEEPVAPDSNKSEEEPITKEEAEVKQTGQRKRNHTPGLELLLGMRSRGPCKEEGEVCGTEGMSGSLLFFVETTQGME